MYKITLQILRFGLLHSMRFNFHGLFTTDGGFHRRMNLIPDKGVNERLASHRTTLCLLCLCPQMRLMGVGGNVSVKCPVSTRGQCTLTGGNGEQWNPRLVQRLVVRFFDIWSVSSSNQTGFLKTEVSFPRHNQMVQNPNSENLSGLGQLFVCAEIGFARL